MPLLVAVAAVVALGGSVAGYLLTRSTPTPAVAPVAAVPTAKPVTPIEPKPPRPTAKPVERSYPLRSLLELDVTVDIDGSRAHLLALFPTIGSEPGADKLVYRLPLQNPWFGAVEMSWNNEKAGRLTNVRFDPPRGDERFKNQKQIGDCLARGLGKPEVRELNHLTGELSFFWGARFPKAWADLYSGYLRLAFENPKGAPPMTFGQVVRSLDACAPGTP